jgi:hypothetical protein
MIELAIWLGTLLMLFVGLLIGLYVLRNIFQEGIDRQRSGGGPGSPGDAGESDAETGGNARGTSEHGRSGPGAYPSAVPRSDADDDSPDTIVCSACETENDRSYTYCQECTKRL